ncbi:MAG: hypothetical protein JJE25_09120 [Bacteroidia bacterium]|nr:hypothetical protein [Bacteroidia bacterium]
MRRREREKIWDLHTGIHNLEKETPEVIKWFPFYARTLKELSDKTEKIYGIYLAAAEDTKRESAIKRISKAATIRAVMKLKRAVMLDAAGKKMNSHPSAHCRLYLQRFQPPR